MSDTRLRLRDEYLSGGWPSGAPVEEWAEKATHFATRQLSRLVLALEAQATEYEAALRVVEVKASVNVAGSAFDEIAAIAREALGA